MESVSIVIVNWNTGTLLKKCVESLVTLPEYAAIRHIVVVDNASSDSSLALAKPLIPSFSPSGEKGTIKITLLPQQINLGFAKATNLGIKYIHEHDGIDDHILLLNPDTEVRPHAIENMRDVLRRNNTAGIVGSKLLHPNGTIQKSVRTFPTLPILAMLFLKLQRIFPNISAWRRYMMDDFDYSREQAVDQVMGASFLIHNSLLSEIGLLDEAFWIWFEEVDYCKRAKDAHRQIIYTPHAEVVHYGGVSFNQLYGPKKTLPFLRSALVYAKKHLGLFASLLLTFLYPFGFLTSCAAMLARKAPISPVIAWGTIAIVSAVVLALLVSAQMGLAVLAFAIVAWWVWEYSEEGLLFFIVISPLLPLLKITQTLGNASLVKDAIIATLFLKTFLAPLLSKTLPYRANTFLAPTVALATWAILQTIHAPSQTLAILRLRDILLYILLYIAVLYLPHTKQIMRTRFLWFIATLIAVIMLGAIQFKFFPDSTVLRFDPARQIWIPRMASTFGHPTVYAEFLVTAAMVFIGYLLAGYKNTKNRIAILVLLITTLPLLYYTYTRASWIALVAGVSAIGIVYFLPLYKGRRGGVVTAQTTPTPAPGGRSPLSKGEKSRRILLATTFGLLLTFSILRFTHAGTFLRSAFDPTYASNAARFGFVTQLIAQTSNSDALIGKGLGSSITQTNISQDVTVLDIASGASRTIQLSQDATLVDNQYLKTFIEMGVVGIVFTLWLFWRFFEASLRLIRAHAQGTGRMLGIAGVGFIAAFAVQALFVDIWDVYPTNAIFWILAALISQATLARQD